jgi:peptidyl-prolyl cis-trans isomerase SurA
MQQSGRNLATLTPDEVQHMRREILKRMIQEKVLVAQADAESLQVVREDIIKQRDAHLTRLMERYNSPEEFNEELKNIYGIGLTKLKQRLYKQYANEMLKMQLRQKMMRNIKLTKSEVEDFFNRYSDSLPLEPNSVNVSHIMIKVRPNPELETKALSRIKEILDKLAGSESFEDLAKEYSEDPGTRDRGGDLGFFQMGEMDPTFERTAFKLDVGQISKPVRSQFGYHIIKLVERRERTVHAKHILIMVRAGEEDVEKTRNWLDSIGTLCANDSLFTHYAEKYSQDKTSAGSGGNLGWMPEDELNSEYAETVKNLQEGNISKAVYIKPTNSAHIFKVIKRNPERKYSLKEDWNKISQYATNFKLSRDLERMVEEWQGKIYIENRLQTEDKEKQE